MRGGIIPRRGPMERGRWPFAGGVGAAAAPGSMIRRLSFRAARRAARDLDLTGFETYREDQARHYDRLPAWLGRDGGLEAAYARHIEGDLLARFGADLVAAAACYLAALPPADDPPARARLRHLTDRASGRFWMHRPLTGPS